VAVIGALPEISTLTDDIDHLIHEPARLMLVPLLHVIESADFISLMGQTGLTWGNLSAHLRNLEEAGYIDIQIRLRGNGQIQYFL
jgi:DNA-binding transcriptional ArsR family regulator